MEDASAVSFMRAFRRFKARRSTPSVVLSDNAPIFVQTSVNLRRISLNEKITTCFSTLNIRCKFITVNALYFGGAWERLIGSTKLTLRKVLGNSVVNFHEMSTLLCEIEG